jgi:outer membrane protein OmpA-like peptidoglycan-associated protein
MNIKNLLLVAFLVFSYTAFGQQAAIDKANDAYANGNYAEAAELSATAYEKISPKNAKARGLKADMATKAAVSYKMIFNYDESISWFQRAIDLKNWEKDPSIYFEIAELYRKLGEYEKAKLNYQSFLELVPLDKRAENALASMNKATVLKDNRTRYSVKNEFKINTDNIDMTPAIADRKGNVIVFGSTRKAPVGSGVDPIIGEPYFNIWQAEFDKKGNWTEPIPFAEGDSINTEYNEGTMAFDGRLRKMFFTRCPNEKKQNLGCQIWVSERKGRAWGMPAKIDFGMPDSVSIGHPCPTEDGMKIIFASDMPNGLGGMDLWMSEYNKKEDAWSTPVNLGPGINTPGDELFPTFALNGDLLYASNGLSGLGGLDIFRAEKDGDNDKWSSPSNLGTPINSDKDDFHLLEMDKRNGYFSSNRSGSKGTKNLDDIWSYNLPPNLFDLKVIVTEIGSTDKIDGVTVEVTQKGGGTFKGVTNSQGTVFWDKQPNGDRFINEETEYAIKLGVKEGYHENTETSTFTTVGLEFDQNFIIEMGLLAKKPIVLPEVRYDLGSAVLQVIEGTINSKDSLNYVFGLLEEYPGMVLKLMSHTDSRGSAKSNEDLAQRRAQSCVDYLVKEKGVNPDRLVAVGKGEDAPRTIFKVGDKYQVKKPAGDVQFEEILLTEKFINQFQRSNKELFEQLHQYNRRTEAEVVRMDWTKPVDAPVPAPVQGGE